MKIIPRIISLSLAIVMVGCGEQSSRQEAYTSTEMSQPPSTLTSHQQIIGKVRNTPFEIEQAILKNGTLTLRQGRDFFADVSVDIVTFEKEGLSEKTFRFSKDSGQFKPHIRLGIKVEGQNLPDEITILEGYDLALIFGKEERLGLPFSIKFVSLENGTNIEGSSFATYENIRVVDGALDLHWDSFETLEVLAQEFIELDNNVLTIDSKFGVSYSSFGEDYPKEGFVGYELTTQNGEKRVAKIQLHKDENGWQAINQLAANQIHQAHPIVAKIEGNLRTVEGRKATKVAAHVLEDYLNEQKMTNNTRATRMNCYLTKTAEKASCEATYGIRSGDEIQCHNKNYLLARVENKWGLVSEISDTQKVDYISGELVSKKNFRA